MEIFRNFSLKTYNTFAIEAMADYFACPVTSDEIIELLNIPEYKDHKKLILGGGSNILFLNNFEGLVIHPVLKGINIVSENDNEVLVKANAGENWDEFVEWTVNHDFGGLENLSLIPGTVGACPIQNIGAYGVEVGEFIKKVEAIEMVSGKKKEFSTTDFLFGYRSSIFKNQLKDQFLITSVYFKLFKNPELKTHYGSVEEELKKMGKYDLKAIRKAIINIRESKLPNPEILPNAGSFFKNPVVTLEKANALKKEFPGIACYNTETTDVKIAAGWLIDFLGWKGKRIEGAGVHENQALVLVNYKNSTGNQIIHLATKIKENVNKKFGIMLEFEVNII